MCRALHFAEKECTSRESHNNIYICISFLTVQCMHPYMVTNIISLFITLLLFSTFLTDIQKTCRALHLAKTVYISTKK